MKPRAHHSRCLFTYSALEEGETNYSRVGLRTLNRNLEDLTVFPYTAQQLLRESQRLAGKISIQGVQPKLSVQLSIKEESFNVVERDGTFIVKPQTQSYPELPENEDLSMHLAKSAGFEVPWHGLIICSDESRAYVIKRFDRRARGVKVPQEDFAQLMEASRSTKYQASMEQVGEVIETYCTFYLPQLKELFRRTIFSFLIGNEDMHLKNFSLLTDQRGVVKLTPLYDFLSSTIAMPDASEELALELNGKKSGLTLDDFLNFAQNDCYLPEKLARKEIENLCSFKDIWRSLISRSFLSETMKNSYNNLLDERVRRITG